MTNTITLAGYCPMGCGQTLFAHTDGTILCSLPGCTNTYAVNDILADQETEHVVILDAHDFSIKHPLRERIGDELLDCSLHRDIADLSGPPVPPGRYRVTKADAVWTYSAIAMGDPAL